MLKPLTNVINKFEAGGKSVLGTVAGGIGSDILMKTIDNVTGGNVQRLASINLPIVGPVGLIDAFNYIIYAGGIKISKRGILAVVGAKIATGVISSVGSLSIPGFSGGSNLAPQQGTAQGQAGGPL